MIPLVVSAGLITGHSDHLFKLHDSFVEQGWIKPDDKVDFAIHTWDIPFNNVFVDSLDTYKEKFNIILIKETYEAGFLPIMDSLFGEDAPHIWKPYILFYSFWKACQLIAPNIEHYDIVIKYKADIESNGLPYGIVEDIPQHFKTTSRVAFPFLYNHSFEDCVYGIRVHNGLEERCFTTFPKVVKKLFLKKEIEDLIKEVYELTKDIYSRYIKPYTRQDLTIIEGPALWGEFMTKNDVPIIGGDLSYVGKERGYITPKFILGFENRKSFVINPERYEYVYIKNEGE